MSPPDLSVTLAGRVKLTACLYNASGPRSGTAEALQKVAHSASAAVLTKSATLYSQKGNPLPRTYHSPDGYASFNSEGLPNSGIDYYISAETVQYAVGATPDKPYIVSLSGKCLADNVEMLRRIAAAPTLSKIAAIELNLACPNVIGKPIIAYDVDQMDEILQKVAVVLSECCKNETPLPPLGVKLPPYLDFSHFEAAAAVLNKHAGTLKYVASINTVGNALAIDGEHSEAPYISSNNGFAGLSGPAVKYTALANVKKLRELLLPEIDVVGVGGIATGQDVYDMLLAGATCCQTATTHWKEGPSCFERILSELSEIMERKGHTSVSQVIAQLKPWSNEGAALARQAAKKMATASSSNAKSSSSTDTYNELQFFRLLSMVLTVLLAIILTDKYLDVKLLPSE